MTRAEIEIAFGVDHLTGQARTIAETFLITARMVDEQVICTIPIDSAANEARFSDVANLHKRQKAASLRDLWNAKCAAVSAVIFPKVILEKYEAETGKNPEG